MTRCAKSVSTCSPKVMVPKQIGATRKLLWPKATGVKGVFMGRARLRV